MRYRQHRGGLEESLKTTREISATKDALATEASIELGRAVIPSDITVKPYGYDNRIRWNTHVVTVNGYGVLGFTDGPVLNA